MRRFWELQDIQQSFAGTRQPQDKAQTPERACQTLYQTRSFAALSLSSAGYWSVHGRAIHSHPARVFWLLPAWQAVFSLAGHRSRLDGPSMLSCLFCEMYTHPPVSALLPQSCLQGRKKPKGQKSESQLRHVS